MDILRQQALTKANPTVNVLHNCAIQRHLCTV